MGSFYRLLIQCDNEQSEKLDILFDRSNDDPELGWSFVIEQTSDQFPQALNLFADLVGRNIGKLTEMGITTKLITFWYMY
ncbi:hypothetical protein [Pedobacter sp. BMA]|uniref:hypothetical protein n=1 Tax=Pedobacter sp. BMA TaxID=1663685 RepID=UPI00064B7BCD|nr:hypothetical protein [Pedobacter sp. BMA]KLT65389.1 hypothetical protein AB669_09865 [Pedobacter sp. BMA]